MWSGRGWAVDLSNKIYSCVVWKGTDCRFEQYHNLVYGERVVDLNNKHINIYFWGRGWTVYLNDKTLFLIKMHKLESISIFE